MPESPAPNIAIRPATPLDVPHILAFICELADYERLSHEVVATEELLAASLFGHRPEAEVLMACADDAPVGFALFFANYSTFQARSGLYLEDLYVRPAFRGLGLGKRLLIEVARLAVARGCGRYEWSVLDWNERALGVYQKIGARPMNEWTVQRLTGAALRDLASSA